MADGSQNIERAVPNPGETGDVTRDYSNGAAHVSVQNNGVVSAYESADYVEDKATSTTTASEAIPTGAKSVWVSNESVTAAEAVRFRFGDVTVVATATTGFRLYPGNAAAGDIGKRSMSASVPPDATHWAYIAEAGTPTINVVWGK